MVITSGQLLVRSMLEEKSNRVIEVSAFFMLGAGSMTGKIIGLSGLGILQMLVMHLSYCRSPEDEHQHHRTGIFYAYPSLCDFRISVLQCGACRRRIAGYNRTGGTANYELYQFAFGRPDGYDDCGYAESAFFMDKNMSYIPPFTPSLMGNADGNTSALDDGNYFDGCFVNSIDHRHDVDSGKNFQNRHTIVRKKTDHGGIIEWVKEQ